MLARLSLLLKKFVSLYPLVETVSFLIVIFVVSLGSYVLLLRLNRSHSERIPKILRRYFFINADKSSTGALQIGGIVFSFVSVIGILGMFHFFSSFLLKDEGKILDLAFFSWVGILIYGHLDDVFEIRPVAKLMMQLGVVLLFCLRAANVVYPENSAFAFVIMSGASILILNGANLIDGLDTLTYKVSTSIFGSFVLLAAISGNLTISFLALIFFASMCGFYFVNRAPSRVHMGEVGVGSIGFAYIVLSALSFMSLRSQMTVVPSLMVSLLPCALPIVEIVLSSLRRIFNNKSPFKGDKLHIHHILHLHLGFSAPLAASLISGVSFLLFSLVYVTTIPTFPLFSFSAYVVLLAVVNLLVAHRYWFSEDFSFSLKFVEKILIRKDVRIISSNALSGFKVIIPPKVPSQETDKPLPDENQ